MPAAVLPTPTETTAKAVQLVLPITVVLVGDGAGVEGMIQQRRYRRPCCHARAQQLQLDLLPSRHQHVPQASARSLQKRPRRQRPVRPHAAADGLALQHRDLAEKIAGNFARRTVHPREDLLQLAMIGLIKAARRYDPSRGPFRPYGRTYANEKITHFLRDNGFLLKVPPTWRELHARGHKLLREGVAAQDISERLGITVGRWGEICQACAVRLVAMSLRAAEEPVR